MRESIKARILATWQQHPDWSPTRIAREVGCGRGQAWNVIDAAKPVAEVEKRCFANVSNPKATGSGRQQVAGYLRLM